MRYEDPDNIILKDVLPPEEDYDFHVESQTLEDLSKLENSDQLIVEYFVAAERILGKYNINTVYLTIRGEEMAHRNKFSSCRKLWNRAINIEIHNNNSITALLQRHCCWFSTMIKDNMPPESEWMINILSRCVEELKRHCTRSKLYQNVNLKRCIMHYNVSIMHIALFLAEALISDAKTSNGLKFDVKKLIYQLIKLKPTNTHK